MDYMYIGLIGMPEIFSDLMNSLGREDLKQEYFKRRKSYEVTINVPINDLIFDDDSQIQNCSEKTKLILKYVTNYLCYKMSKGKCYCFNNPIIRLPDDKNVDNEYIHAVRCIEDAKEILDILKQDQECMLVVSGDKHAYISKSFEDKKDFISLFMKNVQFVESYDDIEDDILKFSIASLMIKWNKELKRFKTTKTTI